MATPRVTAVGQTREDSWRLRFEQTQARYREATEHYRRLLLDHPDGTPHDPKGALALARQAESKALAEYSRVLRAFSKLTLRDKISEDRSAAASDSL